MTITTRWKWRFAFLVTIAANLLVPGTLAVNVGAALWCALCWAVLELMWIWLK